jgi:DNA-binding LacI/PurR family transcriptional regulator
LNRYNRRAIDEENQELRVNKTIRLADVAKAAGVSQGTASNVFSRPDVVRKEVRDRVEAAAKSMGYRGPDLKGRLLRAGKVNAIGVATVEPLSYFFEDPFARVLMTGISAACDASGSGMSLVSAHSGERLAWNVDTAIVDGFILLCIEGGPRLVELTRGRGLPFVALELGTNDPSISAVGIDNFNAAKLAARHLAELGHKKFGVLSLQFSDERTGRASLADVEASIYSDSRDRVHGYFAALEEFGVDTTKIPIYATRNDALSVRAALEDLYASEARPTAILAMSDRIALLTLDWLREEAIAVPGEVSIVGFDGVPDGEVSEPPLTTVKQPIADIGRRAVELILEHDGTARRDMLDTELVVRRSTAPPPHPASKPRTRQH